MGFKFKSIACRVGSWKTSALTKIEITLAFKRYPIYYNFVVDVQPKVGMSTMVMRTVKNIFSFLNESFRLLNMSPNWLFSWSTDTPTLSRRFVQVFNPNVGKRVKCNCDMFVVEPSHLFTDYHPTHVPSVRYRTQHKSMVLVFFLLIIFLVMCAYKIQFF